MTIPDCLSQESADDAEQHRVDIGYPFTDTSRKRFYARCERYYAEGYDLEELVDRMITGGWRTIYRADDAKRTKRLPAHSAGNVVCLDGSDPETAKQGLKSAKTALIGGKNG